MVDAHKPSENRPKDDVKHFLVLLNTVNSIHNVYKFYEINERDNESDIANLLCQ